MSKPKQLAHVAYKTRKIDEMTKWYMTVLDVDIRFESPALVFLSFDDEHHRIALGNLELLDPGGKPTTTENGTVLHTSYTYPTLKALLENYERVKNEGILPVFNIHHGMTLSMYYEDPDRNHVECQVDVYETAEDANRFMESEAFHKNPIGVQYSPDDLLEKLRQGAREEDLLYYDADAEPYIP